jgi:hypothetical protein
MTDFRNVDSWVSSVVCAFLPAAARWPRILGRLIVAVIEGSAGVWGLVPHGHPKALNGPEVAYS